MEISRSPTQPEIISGAEPTSDRRRLLQMWWTRSFRQSLRPGAELELVCEPRLPWRQWPTCYAGVTPQYQAHSRSISTDYEGRSESYRFQSYRNGKVVQRQTWLWIHYPDGIREDIFVHHSSIVRNTPRKYRRSVCDGERVEFDVVEGRKGVMAINVTGPCGANVFGSRYAANIDELNLHHHASRLSDNRQRPRSGGARTIEYQSTNSRGGAGKKHLNDRASSHSEDQDYQPRQPRSGLSYDQPRDSMSPWGQPSQKTE